MPTAFRSGINSVLRKGSRIPLIERFNMSETRQFWRKTLFQVMVVITGVAINYAALPLAWGNCFRWGIDPLW